VSGNPCDVSPALFQDPGATATHCHPLSTPRTTHSCMHCELQRCRLWHNQLQKFDTPGVNGQKARFSNTRRHFSCAIFPRPVNMCVCFICISVFDFCRRWRLFNLTCRSVAQQQPNEINKSAPPFGSNLSLCSGEEEKRAFPLSTFHFSRAVPRPQTCGQGLSANRCAYKFIIRATRRMSDVVDDGEWGNAPLMGWQFLMPT